MQQMSFVQQICAKKWVFLGYYLEQYPRIYFSLIERLGFSDISNFQMLLCLDSRSQLFDYVINNFGLDSQLKTVIHCLQCNSLQKSDLTQFKNIDTVKLRLELVYFLRLIIQICISEATYMQQLKGKKDEHVDL